MEKAVEVVSLVRSPDAPGHQILSLNAPALESILGQAGRRKISIISIVGPQGTGKSFLLSFVIRYLESIQHQEQQRNALAASTTNESDTNPNGTTNGAVPSWYSVDPVANQTLKGFPFESSVDVVTKGMSLWSRPFFLDNDRLALFLMDTRGMYESDTGTKEWSAVFGTSLLVSSNLIFNVSRQLQEDSLLIFDTFLQHRRLLLSSSSEQAEDNPPAPVGGDQLTILIRDWNNPDQHAYGLEGGSQFLERTMAVSRSMTPESVKVRESLKAHFNSNMNCFLLPHPEEYINDIEFNQRLHPEALDSRFSEHLLAFLQHLLSPQHLRSKDIDGRPATPETFVRAMTTCVDMFNKSLSASSGQSLQGAAIQMHNDALIQQASHYYEKSLEFRLANKSVLKLSKLESIHLEVKTYLVRAIDKQRHYGSATKETCLMKLDQQIAMQYQRFKDKIVQQCHIIGDNVSGQAIQRLTQELAQLTPHQRMSQIAFHDTWSRVEAEVKKEVALGLKKVDENLQQKFLNEFESKLEKIKAEMIKKNLKERGLLVEENQKIMEEAVNLYHEKMILVYDDEAEINGVGEKILDKSHQAALKSSLSWFDKKSTLAQDLDSELRQQFLQTLQQSIQNLYQQMVRGNNETLQGIEMRIESTKQQIFQRYCTQMAAHVQTLDFMDDNVRQKFLLFHKTTLQDAQDEFDESAVDGEHRQICSKVRKSLVEQIQGHYQEKAQHVQSQIDGQLQQSEKMTDTILHNFVKDAKQIYEAEGGVETLEFSRNLLTLKNEAFRQAASSGLNSSHVTTLTAKIEDESRAMIEASDKNWKQSQLNGHTILTKIVADYETKMADIDRLVGGGLDQFLNHQTLAEQIALREFHDQSMAQKLPRFLSQQLEENLKSKLKTANGHHLQLFKSQREMSQSSIYDTMKEKAEKLFLKKVDEIIHQFDIIPETDWDTKMKQIRSEVLDKIRDKVEVKFEDQGRSGSISSGGFGDKKIISDILSKLKTKLAAIEEHAWARQKVANAETEVRIKKEMKKAKQTYEETLAGKSNTSFLSTYGDDMDDLLEEFRSNCRCSDPKQTESWAKELRKELSAIQKNVQREEADKFAQDEATAKLQDERRQAEQARILKEQAEQKERTSKTNSQFDDPMDIDEAEGHLSPSKRYKERPLPTKSEKPRKDINLVIADATLHYRTLMASHFNQPIFFKSDRLKELHGNCTRRAFDQIPIKDYDLKTDRSRIFDAFELALKEFEKKNNMNAPTSFAIGIDLGTTYSCVGVYINGKVEIIPDEKGRKTMPSYVSYAGGVGGAVIVGDDAKTQSHICPERTVYEVKRLIGRKFDDPAIQADIAKWPFKVVQEKGIPKVQIDQLTYHPEQISSQILVKLKEIAETYLKQQVKRAVITVPAYFTDGQRQATINAGEAAGLEVLRIINEPTAAAYAYNLDWASLQKGESKAERKGLVFDLGGGTFDVAIYSSSQGEIKILNVGGDTHLGGVDFDNEMVNYCIAEFERQNKINLVEGRNSSDLGIRSAVNRKLMRLKAICEIQKKNLSSAARTTIGMECIHQAMDLKIELERSKFEQLIDPLIQKSLNCLDLLLKDVRWTKDDIDDIVLVGGSTRIPKLREALKKYFGGKKELSTDVDPDEAVAIGAAFEAAVLNGELAQASGDKGSLANAPKVRMSITDVTPMTLGIEVDGGRMFPLIKKQSPIPAEASSNYTTTYNQQTSVQIVIFEGEKQMARENEMVGEFYLNGIPPGLAGMHTVKVTMKVSKEGIVVVTASCNENGVEKQLTVRANKKRMSAKDIADCMVQKKR